jgi:outer membrane receptor protein involved in Fe transport
MTFLSRKALLGCGAAAIALAMAGGAMAQQRSFNLPSQEAVKAIPEFARQAGIQIVAPAGQLRGVRTPALHGELDARAALAALLRGTGLEVASDSGSVITLRQGVEGSQPAGPAAGRELATQIEEVVVTATKRTEDIQKVPFTVTALGEKDIKARGAQSVEQAIAYVPGVSFSSNGTNSGSYSIRGVSTSTSVVNTQSPVALYIDDINILDPAYPKVTTNLRMFDIARVEVLEGPQGTLFGSGALGGAIRVITNKPDLGAFEAATQDTVAFTNGGGTSYSFNGMVNAPLVQDKLALRVVGYYDRGAGWVDNSTRGESDVNRSVSQGGRVELKWAATPDLTFVASALVEDDKPRDSAYSYYANHEYNWDGAVPNANYNNTKIYSLSGDYDLGWASATSITTYADRQESALADFTAVATGLLGITAPSPIDDSGPSRTFSQELRLASPSTDRLRWLVGGLYMNNRRTVDETVLIPGSGALFGAPSDVVSFADTRTRIREQALFGEVSFDLQPSLTLTAGARAFKDTIWIDQAVSGTLVGSSATSSKSDESAVTPKINLAFHPTEATMIYAQAATGYRIGQVNTVASDPLSGEIIPSASRPDSLWNYELGEKSSFFNGRLLLNVAAYYIDWSDIQLDQKTLASGIFYTANAGKAHVEGVEVEIKGRPTAELELGGSLSLNHSRLVSVNPTVVATIGDRLPGSAPVNAVGYAQYTWPLNGTANLFGRVDVRYVGKAYSDLENATSLTYGRYTDVSLRGGVEWDDYAVTAFVNNVGGGRGAVSAFPLFNQPVAIRQTPLTAGVTLDARF